MNQNIKNIRIDEVLEELYHLREENQELKVDNDFLERQNNGLKLRCSKYAVENRELKTEVSELRFTNKYLLGKPMTPEEVAISEAENRYDAYVGDDF